MDGSVPEVRRPARQDTSKALAHQPQVYVFGEIEGAVPNWPLVRLYCSWRLVFDTSKFRVIQGETEGETFTSHVGEGFCVWNHPMAVHLALKHLQVHLLGLFKSIFFGVVKQTLTVKPKQMIGPANLYYIVPK
eukprot:symbB.v1.2.039926.t1/scaffold6870.1/size28492/2